MKKMQDLHQLPKLSDSVSYLYVEHCLIEQSALAVEKIDKRGRTMIPAANLTVLMLGPGTSITHAAIKALADNGCGIIWVGQDATHFYAHGSGETRQAHHLLHQARLVSDPALRLAVCQRMYRMRFVDKPEENLSIQQLRGKEGARVRMAYEKASILYKVPWSGRNYDRQDWGGSDPINRALSSANALLYGLCHSAIVSGGYSPALGFIHTGKQRSFVFDVADLYKTDLTIPIAFQVVSESPFDLDTRVRSACRAAFRQSGLLKRILPDIARLLALPPEEAFSASPADTDMARPEPLWTPPDEKCLQDRNELPLDTSKQKVETCVMPRNTIYPQETEDAKVPHIPAKIPLDEPQDGKEPALKTVPFPKKKKKDPLTLRRERAQKGLQSNWIVRKIKYTNTWRVFTESGPPGYIVADEDGTLVCNCPDYEKQKLQACKHTFAVQLWERERR
jgi:CRISPR-associated protein Cas1